MEYAIELEERLFVEGNEVEVGGGNSGFRKAVIDGLSGEFVVVFFTGESFLLGGGDDLAILDQAGGTIVVESGNSEDSGFMGRRRHQDSAQEREPEMIGIK